MSCKGSKGIDISLAFLRFTLAGLTLAYPSKNLHRPSRISRQCPHCFLQSTFTIRHLALNSSTAKLSTLLESVIGSYEYWREFESLEQTHMARTDHLGKFLHSSLGSPFPSPVVSLLSEFVGDVADHLPQLGNSFERGRGKSRSQRRHFAIHSILVSVGSRLAL